MRIIIYLLMLSSITGSSALAGDAQTVCDQFVNQDPGFLIFDPRDCCIFGNYRHDCHVYDRDGINRRRMSDPAQTKF
jgi:hypothetical protein